MPKNRIGSLVLEFGHRVSELGGALVENQGCTTWEPRFSLEKNEVSEKNGVLER